MTVKEGRSAKRRLKRRSGEAMKARSASPNQSFLLGGDLLELINPKNPLLLLAGTIPWEILERELEPLYADVGRPAKPIRLMCGLLILKQIENISDDHLMFQWVQNPYFQAFCGERVFQWQPSCASSDLSHFRKRIGEQGAEKIFFLSVLLHGEKALEKEVLIDTTVQEKNITFPTDSKLQCKAIAWCWKVGGENGIVWRRSYAGRNVSER